MEPKGIPRNSRTEVSFMEGEVIPLIVPKLGILIVAIGAGTVAPEWRGFKGCERDSKGF